MARTQGKLVVRGQAGYSGHGIDDSDGRSVFSIPSTSKRPLDEREANAEFAVLAWNSYDALIAENAQLRAAATELRNRIANVARYDMDDDGHEYQSTEGAYFNAEQIISIVGSKDAMTAEEIDRIAYSHTKDGPAHKASVREAIKEALHYQARAAR